SVYFSFYSRSLQYLYARTTVIYANFTPSIKTKKHERYYVPRNIFHVYLLVIMLQLTFQIVLAFLQRHPKLIILALSLSYLRQLFSILQLENHYYLLLNNLYNGLLQVLFPLKFDSLKKLPRQSLLHIGTHNNYNKNVE